MISKARGGGRFVLSVESALVRLCARDEFDPSEGLRVPVSNDDLEYDVLIPELWI